MAIENGFTTAPNPDNSRDVVGTDDASRNYSAPPAAKPQGYILVVHGNVETRLRVREALGEVDQQILEVTTTSAAIDALARVSVDLILIDVSVPEIGAIEFCKLLRKSDATRFLPIFVQAEQADEVTEIRAIEAGADEFMVGPLRRESFRARVLASLRHKALIDFLDDSESVIFALAKSVEDRDPDLSQHCQRLSIMSAAMGLALHLPQVDILALQRGGYLHDIGKIGLPDHVLFKPGKLTADEWKVMKSHTERGEKICAYMKSLASVVPIIRSHHERWDGSGYPDGLAGDDIPLLARILQLADIYDALTTERPYKRAFSPEEAIQIIHEETAKGWRDPNLVEVFADLLPMFRTSVPADFTRISLQALSASLDRHRRESTGAASTNSPAISETHSSR